MLFFYTHISFAQLLIIDKINDIETIGIYGGIKQIEPLSSNKVAILLLTANNQLYIEYENLSIADKDTSYQILQNRYRHLEDLVIQFSNDQKNLYALKRIRENYLDFLLYSYKVKTNELDSSDIDTKGSPRDIVLTDNKLSFFRGPQHETDSILMEQVFDIETQKMTEVWRLDTIIKSFGRGYKTKDRSFYTLGIPTYGAYVPDRTPGYLVVKDDSLDFQQIEFYSSNEAHNFFWAPRSTSYNPIFPISDSIVYVVYEARKQFNWDWTHRNFILTKFNIKQGEVSWQYHGLENYTFSYIKPTSNGTHIFYDGAEWNPSNYQFINNNGELVYEENNTGLIKYCTANDKCFELRNDTIFLKKFGEVLAFYAFEDLEDYNMNTYHPDDKHHYVSLKKRDDNIISIYQMRLDTMVNVIEPTNTVESFDIHPNPATNIVNLTFPSYQNYRLSIHQLNGKAVVQYNFTGNEFQLNNLSLPMGTYIIKASGQNNKQYFAKLLWLGD